MSVVRRTKKDVVEATGSSTEYAEMKAAYRMMCAQQDVINSKLDMLIALQKDQSSSPTMQKKTILRAIQAPPKRVQIRNPPVDSEITFKKEDPTEELLDVTRLPKPTLKRRRNIKKIERLLYSIQDRNDDIDSDSETSDDEYQETPKRPRPTKSLQPTKRSPRLQNKRQKK